jgi:hypothetical protein
MHVPSTALAADAQLTLGIPGFGWSDLFQPDRLAELHGKFLDALAAEDPEVARRFEAYRACRGEGMKPEAISHVLVDVAPHVSAFVARLFGVEEPRRAAMARTGSLAPIFRMKDQLVKRRALKRGEVADDPALDDAARTMLWNLGAGDLDDELAVARVACELLDLEAELKKKQPAPGCAAGSGRRRAPTTIARWSPGCSTRSSSGS